MKHYNQSLFYLRKKRSTRFLIICLSALVLIGCSTTRRLEKREHREVYGLLGMEENHKDNFALYKEAASWLHTPHVEGGLSHNGIDCSGLVYVIYKNVYDKTIERNSETILKRNCDRIGRARLRAGDLVFFNTTGLSRLIINHVGVYLRDNKFIHTSLSKGVMISSLDESYFRKTWVCGGRVKYYK